MLNKYYQLQDSSIVTSVILSSYAMGFLPLTNDEKILNAYSEYLADITATNEEIQDDLNNEKDTQKSLAKTIIQKIITFVFPKILKNFSFTQDIFKDITKLKKSFEGIGLYFSVAKRTVILIVSTIIQGILRAFWQVLKYTARIPIGLGLAGASAGVVALYLIFFKRDPEKLRQVKENLDNQEQALIQDISSMPINYPEEYKSIRQTAYPIELSNIDQNALINLRNSKEDIFTPETEILHTMKTEGWDKIFYDGDEYSKFGIKSTKDKPRDFIKNLTWQQAYDIYKREYWDAAQVESVPEEMQRIYFNTAVNMGVGAAKDLYKQSGGTLEGFVNARNRRYHNIARNKPWKAKYLQGWLNRSNKEYQESLDAIKNIEKFKQIQSAENAELINKGKVIGTL